jgi:hypothetical protein
VTVGLEIVVIATCRAGAARLTGVHLV